MNDNHGVASPLQWRAGHTAFTPVSASPARVELHTTTFRSMGCDCQVSILGSDPDLLSWAQARVDELDQCWSRFKLTSELNRFNRRAGHWVRVSPDMMTLLHRCAAGYRLSRGVFNPYLGKQIQALGYDRDFDLLRHPEPGSESTSQPSELAKSAVAQGVPLHLRRSERLAMVDPGVEVDSGGIGKGLGAQLVAFQLRAQGAVGAMVSLGGDVVVAGAYPDNGWRINVDDPLGRPDAESMTVTLREGSICTSGSLKRRWIGANGEVAHHVIDPGTGAALESEIVAASAIVRTGWQAEVVATVALVAGQQAALNVIHRLGNGAVLTWDRKGTMSQAQ